MSDITGDITAPSDITGDITAPSDITGDITAVTLRPPAPLVAGMDERAKSVGLSRNACVEKAIGWLVAELPYNVDDVERTLTAWTAPAELSGVDEPEVLAQQHRAEAYRRKLAAGVIGSAQRDRAAV